MHILTDWFQICIIASMIIYWVPITAFVGALSNINNIIGLAPWLGFIQDVPAPILGIITGLLPTILLAVCLILVPIIMRRKYSCVSFLVKAEMLTPSSALQTCGCRHAC